MGNVEYALEYGFPSTHVISVLSHVAITRTYIENHHPGQLDFWLPILFTALGLLAVSRVRRLLLLCFYCAFIVLQPAFILGIKYICVHVY